MSGSAPPRRKSRHYGYNYGLNNDPNSQAYYRYNRDEITTNLEYIGLTSDLGNGWKIDNKLYSYDYYHLGHNGADPNGETQNGTYYGANDVPGQVLHNDYISYGDIFRISKDLGIATLKSGFWYDYQHNRPHPGRRRLHPERRRLGEPNSELRRGRKTGQHPDHLPALPGSGHQADRRA